MFDNLSILRCRRNRFRRAWLITLVLLPSALQERSLVAQEASVRLLDSQQFDRITLNAANGNEVIDTLLLELPNRNLPDPFPTSGTLELRRLSEPSVLYNLPWSSIAHIELYEHLLLAEAEKLVAARDLEQAYEYLGFLHKNYAQLAGLRLTTENYLRQEVTAAYLKENYEEALTILFSLYDENPQHRGLTRIVETVTDRLIAEQLASRDFASARQLLDLLDKNFPQLNLTNLDGWLDKFENAAAQELTLARQAIASDDYPTARQALRRALAILPDTAGAADLLAKIDQESPQIVVGVDRLGTSLLNSNDLDWTSARIARLIRPKLLTLTGFGAEGGNYECRWAKITTDDTGLQLEMKLNADALRHGISAEVLALELLRLADPTDLPYRADVAGLLRMVEIRQGQIVIVHLLRPHVRPEALLQLAIENITGEQNPPGFYVPSVHNDNSLTVAFQRQSPDEQLQAPETIVEKYFEDEDIAFAALLSGEVDLLARVPPWQIARLQQSSRVEIVRYRLPTIHVLLPNYEKSILRRREFRRAICYGIDRPLILNKILLGGENRAGYRVLSGPLPAGRTITDPVGYAYNHGIQPRPYEPRLAAVLATVARNSLAKQATQQAKKSQPGGEADEQTESITPPVRKLILAHPPDPVATTACQTIKLQLDAVGIPVQLHRLDPLSLDSSIDYDLRYSELALWEPIVDVRRLLGPNGLAGNCSSSMSLALRDVDLAENWKEARSRLQGVHQIAFNDLQVIPLWQTFDYFAYHESIQGVGTSPVTLYQNIADWKRTLRGAGR